MTLLQTILHIDQYLFSLVSNYGLWIYFLLFLIVFCETGLIVTPFLPGDSLLFAAGSIAANNNDSFNIQILFITLFAASILGNKINYIVGRYMGPRVFVMQSSWLLNKKHLQTAHLFYENHGGKTIIFARFIPIIRTFAPFVAGAARMSAKQFTFFNIVSALFWVGSLLAAGYFLGRIPFVKQNFSLVIYGIIIISLLPPVCTFLLNKIKNERK
jgi:membrane-associated protein